MEALGRQAVGEKVIAQRLTESRRATEPDTGRLPLRHGGADTFAIQPTIFWADKKVQAHTRRLGICGEAVDGSLLELGSRMKEIDHLRVRRGGTVLETGNEGRDADAGTHPDLARLRIIEIKAAVRAFHGHRHADLQAIPQAAGVVAERLGNEYEPAVIGAPGRGDGVGVRAFFLVRGDEGELPGGVAAPAVLDRKS